MNRPLLIGTLVFVNGLVWLGGSPVAAAGITVSRASAVIRPVDQAKISGVYGKLPLSFEANTGQVSPEVDFLCRGAGMTLFLSGGEAVLTLRGPEDSQAVVRMQPVGAAQHPRGVGLDPQITKTNYFVGNDPQQWHTDIANFGQVRYPDVYPGIDLVYRGNQRRLEYDLVIAPGADPNQIRFSLSGVDSIHIGAQGELILHTAAGDLLQPAPTVYQEVGERRHRVEGHYVLLASPGVKGGGAGARQQVSFAVGHYDRVRPLIIDPVLVYSTFLGGSGSDQANDIALDGAGNAYVTGFTASSTFPGLTAGSIQPANGGGSYDAFVTKINTAGTAIVYSTFLGGSGDDGAYGIAVDSGGNAYIAGVTQGSTTFPGVTAGSIQPAPVGYGAAFVTKINAAGTAIVYSTFLGGGGDSANGIAVDGAGNAYVTGVTYEPNFPGISGASIQSTLGGVVDAFVTKINAAGTAIVYSTFLGGSGYDGGLGIAVDGSGNAYVGGFTFSNTFTGVTAGSIQPVNGGDDDAFVTKINAAGTAIVYSTFLGGSGGDQANRIAVDAAGNAYVAGATGSPTFTGVTAGSIQPANGGGGDAFVTKINAAGTAIVYSTFLGGSGLDQARSIALDGDGNAYLTGWTASSTFPGVSAGSIQPANGGGSYDAFVTKLNSTGTAILYSTFLGGSGGDAGQGIAVDSTGNAYVTGFTASSTFPGVSAGSIQPANGGGSYDAFVTKIGRVLNLSKTHVGNFTQGQTNATYSLTASNSTGAGPTDGSTVTVTDTVPGGLTFVSMVGTNWSCVSNSCTRSDVLNDGSSYEPITVTVDVPFNATSPQVNQASVSGGGAASANASDSTTIMANPPVLSLNKSHAGNFAQGQTGATYALTVSNKTGTGPTTGTVTVTETVPAGLTFVSMAGTNWTCVSNSCTRSDVVNGGSSYESITVTVNVPLNATSPQVNQASVSGGGSATANASDPTTITGLAFFTVAPCRVVDTRGPTGTFGGPPIPASGGTRTFPFVSAGCSVPAAARAVSINITVVNAGAAGYLDLFSGDLSVAPLSSTINFSIGQTRANNSVVQVSTDGNGKLTVFNGSSASNNVVLDVNGYFE